MTRSQSNPPRRRSQFRPANLRRRIAGLGSLFALSGCLAGAEDAQDVQYTGDIDLQSSVQALTSSYATHYSFDDGGSYNDPTEGKSCLLDTPGGTVISLYELFYDEVDGGDILPDPDAICPLDPRVDAKYGSAVNIGDLDNDGYNDVIAGAPGFRQGRGSVEVRFGTEDPHTFERRMQLEPDAPIQAAFGTSVAVGDINCDGIDDLAVGAPEEEYDVDGLDHASQSFQGKDGRVYLYIGGDDFPNTVHVLRAPYQDHRSEASQGRSVVKFDGDNSMFGTAVAFAKVGGGCNSLLVTAPGYGLTIWDTGAVFSYSDAMVNNMTDKGVAYGPKILASDLGIGDELLAFQNAEFGVSIAVGAGENGKHDTVAIGAPGHDDDAGGIVIWKDASGDDEFTLIHQGTPGVVGTHESGDRFGEAMAFGDFDEDGKQDLVVGLSGEDIRGLDDVGSLIMFWRWQDGTFGDHDDFVDQEDLNLIGQDGDHFGSHLAVADMDGDGTPETLAVGVPKASAGAYEDGRVDVYGRAGTKSLRRVDTMRQGYGLGATAEDGDGVGSALAFGPLGDGDNVPELVIGCADEDVDGRDAGNVHVKSYRPADKPVGPDPLAPRRIILDPIPATLKEKEIEFANQDGDYVLMANYSLHMQEGDSAAMHVDQLGSNGVWTTTEYPLDDSGQWQAPADWDAELRLKIVVSNASGAETYETDVVEYTIPKPMDIGMVLTYDSTIKALLLPYVDSVGSDETLYVRRFFYTGRFYDYQDFPLDPEVEGAWHMWKSEDALPGKWYGLSIVVKETNTPYIRFVSEPHYFQQPTQ